MHRLQISLPHWQVQFLTERARRDGVSIAEVIRQLVSREAEASRGERHVDSLWGIAGIAVDREPLVVGWAVSERPELYLDRTAHLPKKDEKPSRHKRRT